MHFYSLTNTQWDTLLKTQYTCTKRKIPLLRRTDRRFVNLVISLAKQGTPWTEIPPEFGPFEYSYMKFQRWARTSRWDHIFHAVAQWDLSSHSLPPGFIFSVDLPFSALEEKLSKSKLSCALNEAYVAASSPNKYPYTEYPTEKIKTNNL